MVLHLPDGMEGADVRIVDPAGRLLQRTRVAQRTGIVEVPATGLAGGLYAVQVVAEGIDVATTKFEVVR